MEELEVTRIEGEIAADETNLGSRIEVLEAKCDGLVGALAALTEKVERWDRERSNTRGV